MPLSIYQLSIPAFLRGLAIAGEYCRKASAFCIEREISPSTLIDARLAPDMLPFAGQIQRISDTSKRPAARLAAIEPPAYEDAERTFPELQAELEKTSGFLKSISPAQLDGAPSRVIEVQAPVGWRGAPACRNVSAHPGAPKFLLSSRYSTRHFTAHGRVSREARLSLSTWRSWQLASATHRGNINQLSVRHPPPLRLSACP